MKFCVAWMENVDLVAIQSSDPQARIFNWPIFGVVRYVPPKSSEGHSKLEPKDNNQISNFWGIFEPRAPTNITEYRMVVKMVLKQPQQLLMNLK
jgi:hypothetical protein